MTRILLTLLSLCFISMTGPLTAQNLLDNGEFDSDINGWFAFSTITWVSDDGASISGHGSMMNSNSFNNGSSFPAISDKFTVYPNYWYMSGVSYKIPTPSPVQWVWYVFYWYDDMNNQISTSSQISSEYGGPHDVWGNLTGMSQAPPGAAMGELRIYLLTAETGETELPFGLWDDVFVFEETIFTNSFD